MGYESYFDESIKSQMHFIHKAICVYLIAILAFASVQIVNSLIM